MALTELLAEENWADYDNRKIRDKRDSRFFACTETWEVDYLKALIRKKYPDLSDSSISDAIKNCCMTNQSPHPRKTFTECVLKRLGVQ